MRLLRPRQHLVLVAANCGLRKRVVLDDACCPFPQNELHAIDFAPRPFRISLRSGNISLVAVENGDSHPHVGKALQSNRSPLDNNSPVLLPCRHGVAGREIGSRFARAKAASALLTPSSAILTAGLSHRRFSPPVHSRSLTGGVSFEFSFEPHQGEAADSPPRRQYLQTR